MQTHQSTESLNMGHSIGSTVDLEAKLKQMRRDASDYNIVDDIKLEQSQAQLDISSIIRKYGGAYADASWANELTELEKR